MTFRIRTFAASLLLLPALLLGACSSSSSTPAPTLTGLSVTPTTASLTVGGTRQLTATGTYSDGSTANLTTSASFVSDTNTVATISATGLVTAVAVGTAKVTGTVSGKSAFCTVTVNAAAPTLSSIAIAPNPATVAAGSTLQLVVTGTYSDASTQDVTSTSTFVSGTPSVATVSSPGGLVSGLVAGTTTITATNGTKTATRDVAVTGAVTPPDTNQIVFYDGYGADVTFKDNPDPAVSNNLTIDSTPANLFNGRKVISFPITADATKFSGGSWVTSTPRVLTGYNAVTFWARASAPMTLELVGFGDDTTNTPAGTALAAERHGLPVTTTWQKFTMPIPDPAKFTGVNGLFHLADGTPGSKSKTLFLADIIYTQLGSGVLGTPSASIAGGAQILTIPRYETSLLPKASNQVAWTVTGDPGNPVTMSPVGNAYFDYTSSNSAIASVSPAGLITGVLEGGPVDVTAKLAGANASGSYVVTVTFALARPATLPPVPTIAAGNTVYSLYSSVSGGYNGTVSDQGGKVDTWLTVWSGGSGGTPFAISAGGSSASPRKYVMTNAGNFIGIEFIGTPPGTNEIDAVALGLDTFHIDVWTPDDATNFQVKLVDFGADAIFGGVADTAGVATILPGSTPPLVTGSWMSFDLKLASDFPGLANLNHLAQLILIAPNGGTVYVDNMYFYKSAGGGGGGATVPVTAAPTPTVAAANVISLFNTSGTYSNIAVSTWATSWSVGSVADYTVAGTTVPVKKYSGVQYVGVDFANVDATATGVNTFHVDFWTPDATQFGIKLGKAGGTQFLYLAPTPVTKGGWVSLDIPLSSFPGINLATIDEFLFVDNAPLVENGTYFIDNVYFYQGTGGGGGAPTAPTTAPTPPTALPADVISLLSSTYTGVAIDTWGTGWSNNSAGPRLTELTIAGEPVKEYSALGYVGVEFVGAPPGTNEIDATAMTHFHVDVWTPDITSFQVKLVDFGADMAFGGGDDTDALFVAEAQTTPALTGTGKWVSLDVPLSSFVKSGATWNRNHLAQMLFISGTGSGTAYVANIYFHK